MSLRAATLMRILMAGGSGMVGRHLTASWVAGGHAVTILSRRPDRLLAGHGRLPDGVDLAAWHPPRVDRGLVALIADADAVVTLAGENIGTRPWTSGRRRSILDSRLAATGALVGAIEALPAADRPSVLATASGTDVYGHPGKPCSEATPPAATFLGRVVVAWEEAARAAEASGVRVVAVRSAFVVAADAVAFRLLALPIRLFLGGRIGDGRQPFSFVGIEDLVGIFDLVRRDPTLSGPINAAAPVTPTQAEVAATLARILHRPTWLPVPAPLVRLVLRGQADLILGSRVVVPERALEAGYRFIDPTFAAAAGRALDRPTAAPVPGAGG